MSDSLRHCLGVWWRLNLIWALTAGAASPPPLGEPGLRDQPTERGSRLPLDLPPPDLEYRHGAIVRGPKDARKIALVFTGHEFAEGAPRILDLLEGYQAKASFFLTGDFLARRSFEPTVRRILRGGHYLGPHSDKHLLYCSWDSPSRTLVNRAAFRADVRRNIDKLVRHGVARRQIRFFLPPFEHANDEIAAWTGELGLTLVNYTSGTRSHADYTGEASTNFVASTAIVQSVLQKETQDPYGLSGFLLLFHLGAGPGRADKLSDHLDAILEPLHQKGYRFVRLDALLPSPELEFERSPRR